MNTSSTRAVARNFGVGLIAVIATLALPAAAQAVPPTITSVGHSNRYLTAQWTLPSGMATAVIEASTSSASDADGFFLDPILYAELPDTATSFTAPVQLPPGTYYVHVAAYDPAAPTCVDPLAFECIWEFSTPVSVLTLPPDPLPPAPVVTGTPAPAAPAPDTVTSFSALRAPSKQDVDKLFVSAAMSESGTLSARGTVSVPGASKVFRFKTVTANAVAGVSVKLRLKLPAKGLKAVKRALKRKKKLKAKITVTAKDAAGNTKVQKRSIALRP